MNNRFTLAIRFFLLSWWDAIKRFYSFKGRTSRKSFIVVFVPLVVFSIIWPIGLILIRDLSPKDSPIANTMQSILNGTTLMSGVLLIVMIVFFFPLFSRRFHDFNQHFVRAMLPFGWLSPWHWISVYVRVFKKGDAWTNAFGDPHVIAYTDEQRKHAKAGGVPGHTDPYS